MTPSAAAALLRRLTAGPLQELRGQALLGGYAIRVVSIVPDRDTGDPRGILFVEPIKPCEFKTLTRDQFIWRVRAALVGAATHEIDELLKLDGKRVFETHARKFPNTEGRT